MSPAQLGLLEQPTTLPPGFEYQANFVSAEEERDLLEQFRELAFREFEFQGYLGKRRVVSFGLHYDTTSPSARCARRTTSPVSCCRLVSAPPPSPGSHRGSWRTRW